MAADDLLTQEELAYLQQLMPEPVRRNGVPRFKIEGNWQASELLAGLAANARLTLEAEFDAFYLAFPLRLSEDEFHSQHIELAPPIIYERGPRLRTWRLSLPQPLPLLEDDGSHSGLQVRELSTNSLVVDSRDDGAPRHFHLHLPLPDDSTVPVRARQVRRMADGRTAYALDNLGESDRLRLRRYLFAQHRRLHPTPPPEPPDDLV